VLSFHIHKDGDTMANKTVNNGSITLTATQSNVVSEAKYGGAIRVVLSITNTEAGGGSIVYLSVAQEAKANKGIVLQPGQTFTWAMDSGYMPPLDQVTAYSTGTPTLAIYEEILV
jgi:hypothetical protein